jgi:hypothetical protein
MLVSKCCFDPKKQRLGGIVMLRTIVLPLLCAGLLASAAGAQITLEHFDNDAEVVAALTDTLFVAEGRGGDGAGAATFELDLGPDTGAPAQTAQYGWVSGQAEPFTLVYDALSSQITFSLGGRVLQYATPYEDFGDMFLRTRAIDDGSSVVLDDLVLDGQPLGDQSAAANPGADLDILRIGGADLSQGFSLSGTATLTWTGALPGQSRLAFQIKVAHLGTVGDEDASWGELKARWR